MSRPGLHCKPGSRAALVLQLVSEHGEARGCDLISATNGTLPRGTTYVMLRRLQRAGLLDVRTVRGEHGLQRGVYRLTEQGRAVVAGLNGPKNEYPIGYMQQRGAA